MGCIFSSEAKPAKSEVAVKAAPVIEEPKQLADEPPKFQTTAPKESVRHDGEAQPGTPNGTKPKANALTVDARPGFPKAVSNNGSAGLPGSFNQIAHGYAADESHRKERRAAAGSEAVRDQIRKLAVGGNQTQDEKHAAIYEVSDSEDEDLESSMARAAPDRSKPPEVTEAICHALKKNFVFRGISESLLLEVVERMHGVSFKAGSIVLQQGAVPKPDDCMYYLQLGEADVAISGAVDQSAKAQGGEVREVVGHTVRIPQKPGWVFGDVALLFNSSRTASVVARTNITAWALDRNTFLQFVMKHAQGARALRFLRKLPLLKGLSDNDLIRAAVRMPQRVYQNGEPLIKYGERGDELYLIRYGKVHVMRPDGKGGHVTAVVLGRGQFVGERAVINNKLRSADCVAEGTVQVVVMKKRDFMDLDNPLLAWMMDYDAVSTCLRFIPYVKSLKQEQMEQILDRFDAREEVYEGQTIINEGDMVEKLYVVKLGDVQLYRDGDLVQDPEFVREAGGFSFFGEAALQQPFKCPYTVMASSEVLHMLTLPKRQLDHFLGLGSGLSTEEAVIAALKKCQALTAASDADLKQLLEKADETTYNAGDVIAAASRGLCNRLFLVKGGEVVLVAPDVALSEQIDLGKVEERGKLLPGAVFNEEAVGACASPRSLKASLVAFTPGTTVISFSNDDLLLATGQFVRKVSRLHSVRFSDLEHHRIIGTGQFGLVRLVRNTKGNDIYALKVMHKAPIVESKQMEHVVNERRILEEADHPFCVQLRGAYQDKSSLYLLQEWVPGGELFHHLDLEGAFDEAGAMFFAANVLLSLEFLHSKGIVYRDLKPENLLLDAQGYLKMADFGFAKYVGKDKTYTICGTPDYQAPEVIMRRGTTKAADYWALGVLIFEMLVGDPPFKSLTGDPWDTFRRTLSGRFYVPSFISDVAADIIFKLLQVNPERRLGSGPDGADEIKQHPFFARIDWDALERRALPAPIKPRIRNPLDTSNFDNFDDCDVEAPPVPADLVEKQPRWDLWDWIE